MTEDTNSKYFVIMAIGLVGVIGLIAYLLYREHNRNLTAQPLSLNNNQNETYNQNNIEQLKNQFDLKMTELKDETYNLKEELRLTQEQMINLIHNKPIKPITVREMDNKQNNRIRQSMFGMS